MNFTTWLTLLTADIVGFWLVFFVQPLFEKSRIFDLLFDVEVVLLLIATWLLILDYAGRIER